MAKVIYILKAVWAFFSLIVVNELIDNIIAGEIFRNWDSLIESSIIVLIFWVIPTVISLFGQFRNLLDAASLDINNAWTLVFFIVFVVILYKLLPFIVLLVFLYNILYLIVNFNATWRY